MLKIKNSVFFTVIQTVLLIVITTASLVYLYDERKRISGKLVNYLNEGKGDVYWANEILKGGYILHFRHAERDKWIDVQMYDSLEADHHSNGPDNSRFAENDYFSKAVCLNYRGKIQARAMGEHLKKIGLPISKVITSVSCRARQTADIAFGGYDSMNRLLVHEGPFAELNRIQKLKDFYSAIELSDGKNVVVSAHNSVIKKEMFDNANGIGGNLYLEEGGFYVISKKEGMLVLEHEFNNFRFFTKVFYPR